jgi:hypothetical protein
MSSPTLLEAQFALHFADPEYGTAQEGVSLFDMDARKMIDPMSVNLTAPLNTINDFMVSNGAAAEHLKYTTIGLYRPESKYADGDTTGFVADDLAITGQCGLRFPLIALRHDPNKPDPRALNFNLRHEVYHLLNRNKELSYTDTRLVNRLRATSAMVGTLLTACAANLCYPILTSEETYAGLTTHEYAAGLFATSIGALVMLGTALNPAQAIHAVTLEEHRANYFSRRNRHFQPFAQVQP